MLTHGELWKVFFSLRGSDYKKNNDQGEQVQGFS